MLAAGVRESVLPLKTKTYYFAGGESDLSGFKPDPHDLGAMTTDKKLKVASSKLGAVYDSVRRGGVLKNIAARPVRAAIGIAGLGGGIYGGKKSIEGALKKKES